MKGLVGKPWGRLKRRFRAPRRQVIEPKLNHNCQLILSVKFGRRGRERPGLVSEWTVSRLKNKSASENWRKKEDNRGEKRCKK